MSRSINKLNDAEIARNLVGKGSWHEQYKDSKYIFVGGLEYGLTEGDLRIVFSQYGLVTDVKIPKDKETGKSRGFAFLGYKDQRSTVLAVDNFNGIKLAGRLIKVDHVEKYQTEKEIEQQRQSKKRTNYSELVTDEMFADLMSPGPKEFAKIATDKHEKVFKAPSTKISKPKSKSTKKAGQR